MACCAVAFLLLAAGCGDDEHTDDADAATLPPDASEPAIDAADSIDGAPASDAAQTGAVTFRLTYDPAPGPPLDAIYVHIECTQTWLRVIDGDGERVPIQSDCGLCPCDQCDPCAVCDCAFLIEPVPAGSSRDFTWDGVTHPTRSKDGCGVCEFESTLPAGSYTARFCYAFAEDGPVECADEVFDYPSAGVVEHVVTGPP